MDGYKGLVQPCPKHAGRFDPTKPVQLRNGAKAEILATDMGGNFPILGRYKDAGVEEWISCRWTNSGHYYRDCGISPNDLVNIPEKREVWVNLYSKGCWAYPSREEADHAAGRQRIACVRVEYTEGEGL